MVNVLKYRGVTGLFSCVLMLAFVVGAVYKWNTRGSIFTYSVDFTGGTQFLLKFEHPVQSSVIKDALEQAGWQGVVIREFAPDEILVRVKEFAPDIKPLADRICTAVQEKAACGVMVEQSEAVGAGVGEALRWKSVWAVIYALIAMLIYIATRFWSFSFAVGAVVALFHDAIAMLAVFMFFDREISINVIGAILAVLGYSINDTIVIFSKIRDNLRAMGNASLETVVEVSISQTLTRSLLTSFTTALTVGAMFILGGEALRDFSLALLVGIVFGTYSSIYIASPVMMLLYGKR